MIAILLTTLFIVVDFSESGSRSKTVVDKTTGEQKTVKTSECYHAVDGYDYRGTVSTTVSGYTCQEWTEQSPHSHTRTPENYPNAGLGEHNYCRNPDGTSGAWCYKTDSSVRWELCDIGQPDENCVPASECYHESDGNDYRGTVSMTVNGNTCQEWTEQSPHSHSRTPENYPDAGLGEHNYCRNPDGTSGAWCYTTDSSVRWELCDIGQPEENCQAANECYHAIDAYDYRGTVSRTENGRTCQEWTEQSPHSHTRTPENYPNAGLGEHNYCRNPDGTSGAWCYTTDPNNRWELCDVGQPDENCVSASECYHESDGNDYRGTVSRTENGRTCQEWTEQSPHSHTRTPENYPNAGLGEHNYCRNPDDTSGAWCYTRDSSVRWELCDIGQPEENCAPANECYHETDGNDYRGTVSRTENGRTCQEWTDQSPHSHTRTPENYPNSGLGQHNYCRNPDGTSGAWCYTTDPYSRWELCDIGQPYENCGPPNECYHETDGSDYRGTVSMTVNGRTCQEWTEQSPQSHSRTPENYPNAGLGEHNYCRNPDGWSGVWCYTTDPSVRWEACDIGQPDEHCVVTSAPVTKAPPPTPEAPVVPPHIPTQPLGETTHIPTLPPCEFPDNMRNVAQGKSSTQSSLKSGKLGPDVGPEKAVDGDYNPDAKAGLSCSWTNKELQPWWKVDLGQIFSIYEIIITNREDCCTFRIKNAEVRVGNSENFEENPVCGMMIIGRMTKENPIHVRCGCETPMEGRFVSIQLIDRENMLTLCEVEVMAT